MSEEIITPSVVCKECGTVTKLAKWKVTCDTCGKVGIPRWDFHASLTGKNSDTDYHFCNWECLFKWLKDFEMGPNDCLTLPCIHDLKAFKEVFYGNS